MGQPWIDVGWRPKACTALERLRPRVRIASSGLRSRADVVSMGPCGHVFHRACFAEVSKHKNCPKCQYAYLQCPTCRAELTRVVLRVPFFLRPIYNFIVAKISI